MDSVGQMGLIWENDCMAFVLVSIFGLGTYVLVFLWEVGDNRVV